MKSLLPLASVALLAACGPEASSPVVRLEIEPLSTMVAGVGSSVDFDVAAFDSSGRSVAARVVWHSGDSEVASVSGAGVATGVGEGTTSIIAELGSVTATATLEVWVDPVVGVYEPGTSYFGRRGYVEYIPGTLPLVLSAPHGGSLTPPEIPDRSWGTVVTDSRTAETLLAVRDALIELTGRAPHVVISHLRRTKLDPNREIEEAAQGSPFAEQAWREFHGFLEAATAEVTSDFGAGLYVDVHGHGHDIQRLELGYLLSAVDLNRDDAELDAAGLAGASSLAALARTSPHSLSALVRGSPSFGAYLLEQDLLSVPSPYAPHPGSDPYFSGGYNTFRHGSRAGGTVSALQIEMHRVGIRDTDQNRRIFGTRLARAVEQFMLENFGFFRPD
jgi:N-formylglutamate amidohydrolase